MNKITIDYEMKYTNKEYIEKCIDKYGDLYDLSEINFIDMSHNVTPICKKHGKFTLRAWDFINKHGCQKCNKEIANKKATKKEEDYIEEYKKTGKTYDLSKFKYVNSKTKSIFICHKKDSDGIEHGEFMLSPYNMLKKGKCPKCRKEQYLLTSEEFYKRCKEIHNNKYEYSKETPYKGGNSYIDIICPIHGKFTQLARSHMYGCGCFECATVLKIACHSDDINSFKEKAHKIHGNMYDYEESEYKHNTLKIKIKCNKCNRYFYQTPNVHLQGCGCPFCKTSHMEEKTMLLLEKKHIKYTYEKHFDWLGLQSLDFYLDDYNIAIECQGEQHFKPMGFCNIDRFEDDIKRDKKKAKLCKENDLPLFYINYNENIEQKLEKILKENKII